MNTNLVLPALIVIAVISACSSTTQRPQEVEAVRDFVAAAELQEVDEIRLSQALSYTYVNDLFVTIPTRRGDYLVEFLRICYELRQSQFTPDMADVRNNPNILRSRFDTIRGCRISKIYEITEAQRAELRNLGDAPGDEIFLPEADE